MSKTGRSPVGEVDSDLSTFGEVQPVNKPLAFLFIYLLYPL